MTSALVFYCKSCAAGSQCKRHELGFAESKLFDDYINAVRECENARVTLGNKKLRDSPYVARKQKAKRAWKRAYSKRVKVDLEPHESDFALRANVPLGIEQKCPKWSTR